MWLVIKNTLKVFFKDKKDLIFYIIFPIMTMQLTAMLLTNAFSSKENNAFQDVVINYVGQGSEEVKATFDEFIKVGEELEIKFNKVDSIELGKKLVSDKKEIFIVLENDELKVYGNDKSKYTVSAVLETLKGVNYRKNLVLQLINIDPVKGTEILQSSGNLDNIKIDYIDKEKTPDSNGYYGIAQLTFYITTIGIIPFTITGYAKRRHIRDRLTSCGVTANQYTLGTIIGSVIINSILFIPGYLYSIFVMKADWGDNLLLPYFIILIYCFLFIALSTLISDISKNPEKLMNVFSTILSVVCGFLGGAFVPLLNNLSPFMEIITNLSPLRWINKGLMDYIYLGDNNLLMLGSITAFILGLIFLVSALIYGSREEKRI